MTKKAHKTPLFQPTKFGRINREIEKSVAGIVAGSDGAIGKTISLAKEREKLLVSHNNRKKIPD